MTKSEFFKLAEKTSLEGGFPANRTDIDGHFYGCVYRTADGARACLVGLTIPNDEYRQDMECGKADTLYETFPQLTKYIPEGMTVDDMLECQEVHDELARDAGPWPHDKFVSRLASLECFQK